MVRVVKAVEPQQVDGGLQAVVEVFGLEGDADGPVLGGQRIGEIVVLVGRQQVAQLAAETPGGLVEVTGGDGVEPVAQRQADRPGTGSELGRGQERPAVVSDQQRRERAPASRRQLAGMIVRVREAPADVGESVSRE